MSPRKESLFDRARRLELQRSQDRLDELDRMKGRLALLQPFLQPLADQGVLIMPSEIEDTEERALRTMPPLIVAKRASQVIAAFKAQGFHEVSRRQAYGHGSYRVIVLANGSLHLQFTLDESACPPAPAQATNAPAASTV